MTESHSQSTIHHSQFTILVIIALALALNLHALAGDSFWGDEILTALFASQSPAAVIRWTAEDIHPPLYYLLAGTFTRLLGSLGPMPDPTPASDWLWRFPSAMAGVLTVAVTYRLGLYGSGVRRQVSGTHRIATFAALLLAVAPIAIKYGQEARMHALFMFLSALATWLFFRAMARPRRWTRWLAFALATTANIYTMYFGFLILAAQAGYVLFTLLHRNICASRENIEGGKVGGEHTPSGRIPPGLRRVMIFDLRHRSSEITLNHPSPKNPDTNKPTPTAAIHHSLFTIHNSTLAGFTAATILSFLLYLPWWPVLFNLLRKRAAVGAIEGGVGHPVDFMRGVVQALGPLPEPVAWGFLGLFFTGVFLLARRNWPLAGFAVLWLGLPVVLPIFLGDPRALQFRYAFVLPVYLTVIVYAVLSAEGAETNLSTYLIWILATLSFIATLGVYQQTKPDWRAAAAYLGEHSVPADIILIGPLWDEGRFIDYYYRGQAQLLTPAGLVTNIHRRAESLRDSGGRVWAVNRFSPAESPVMKQKIFSGVVVSEPTIPVYEPALLAEAAIGLARQAVAEAYPWAAEAQAGGVLDPDPRTAQAAALRALGDTLAAAGRPEEALIPYQTAVDIFPGWVNGYLALAETQEMVGDLPAAAKAYRQAVAFNLNWQGPAAEEAADLVKAGQWTAALEKYHQIIGVK